MVEARVTLNSFSRIDGFPPAMRNRRIKALFLIIFILLLSLNASSQSKWVQFQQLSRPEKWWVIGHPFSAGKAYRCAMEARRRTTVVMREKRLDPDSLGGQTDAFRHGFWMAMTSSVIGKRRSLRLGKAHEKGNYLAFKNGRLEDGFRSDSILCAMDLYNNEVGAGIGELHRGRSADFLQSLIIDAVLAGKMKVIWKDASGHELDCSGNPLSPELFKGKWVIPKCLIGSDGRH